MTVTLVFIALVWYMNFMKFNHIILVLTISLLIAACATGPIIVPENLTAPELIQRGQEASDRNRYSHSIQYYSAVLERFPFDIDYICAAEYEIAFIHYKQKNYDLAKTEFNKLLERYNVPDEELLPPQFKILSGIVLQKIEEAENSSSRARS